MNYKPVLGIAAICFFAMTLLSLKSKSVVYTYIDGNNNNYTISPDSIKYEPITKVESSSGEYDGGEPKTVAITEEQYKKIEDIIKAIIKDKESHDKDRQMGFGTLNFSGKSMFINRNSTLKTELENELKLCLQ